MPALPERHRISGYLCLIQKVGAPFGTPTRFTLVVQQQVTCGHHHQPLDELRYQLGRKPNGNYHVITVHTRVFLHRVQRNGVEKSTHLEARGAHPCPYPHLKSPPGNLAGRAFSSVILPLAVLELAAKQLKKCPFCYAEQGSQRCGEGQGRPPRTSVVSDSRGGGRQPHTIGQRGGC